MFKVLSFGIGTIGHPAPQDTATTQSNAEILPVLLSQYCIRNTSTTGRRLRRTLAADKTKVTTVLPRYLGVTQGLRRSVLDSSVTCRVWS